MNPIPKQPTTPEASNSLANLNILFHKTDAQNKTAETSRTEEKKKLQPEKMSKDKMTSDFQPTSSNVDSIQAWPGPSSATTITKCTLIVPP